MTKAEYFFFGALFGEFITVVVFKLFGVIN
jgi:hypothetical protein